MDKNIHSYTQALDEKWIFLLIINKDITVKNSVVTSSNPIPPPGPLLLQLSISMASLQGNGKLGKSNTVYSKGTKECRLKHKQVRQQ